MSGAAVSPDYQYYLDCGCRDVSDSLGIQKMPTGYALMLDADEMFYFWFELASGAESSIHWNRWAVYRGAVRRSQGGAA